MLVSMVSSVTILAQTRRHFSKAKFKSIFLTALPAVIAGTLLMNHLDSQYLLKAFALLLVAYGCHGLLQPAFRPSRGFRHGFIVLGGFIQGAFTTGGPFVLMGAKDDFDNKTQLKATMAAFFLTCNLWRLVQSWITDAATVSGTVSAYWWLALPVILGVAAGHFVHTRISEAVFRKAVLSCLLAMGIMLMLR